MTGQSNNQDQTVLPGKFKSTVVFYTITRWFSAQDSMIHALKMLLATSENVKKTLICDWDYTQQSFYLWRF